MNYCCSNGRQSGPIGSSSRDGDGEVRWEEKTGCLEMLCL